MVFVPVLDILLLLIFIIILFQFQQSEGLDVLVPYIDYTLVKETIQVVCQMLQLLVLVIIVERKYWHSIVYVEGEAQAAVVDYEHFFQTSVFKNS